MDDKDFFAKLAGVGPDGKFSSFSYTQKKAQQQNKIPTEQTQAAIPQKETQKETVAQKNTAAPINSEQDQKEAMENNENELEGQLAVDVYETPSNFTLEAPVAGVKAEDIDVAITLDSITIRGQRSKDNGNGNNEKKYLFAECFWGKFVRTISFPQEIDADRATASFRNGILKIVLPKIQRDKPKKVKVKFE